MAKKYKMYSHIFPSGYEVEARQYENEILPMFIKFVDEVWIPENAQRYFEGRDPKALDYLPKLLPESKEEITDVKIEVKSIKKLQN